MLVNRLQGVSTVPVSGGDLSLGVLKDSNFLDYFAGGTVVKTIDFRIVFSTNTSLFFLDSIAVLKEPVSTTNARVVSNCQFYLCFFAPVAKIMVWYIIESLVT